MRRRKIKAKALRSEKKTTLNSELKLKNSLIDEYKKKLKAIYETDEDFIFELNANGIFLSTSEYGPTLLEYVAEELIGKHFFEIVSPKDKKITASAFQKILSSDRLVSFNAVAISKFGKEIHFEFNCKGLFLENKLLGMIGIGKNLNPIKIYEERNSCLNEKLDEANRLLSIERSRSRQKKALLEELNRLKNEFISNVSHELRTPLASIIGFSETISTDPEMTSEMRSEFNSVILKEGKRLAHLINDVLDITKVEGNLVELYRSEFDVLKLLLDVVDSKFEVLQANNVILTTEAPDEAIIINADAQKIEQVFNALLDNAIKFTKKNGRISIFVQNLYKEVEIIISDTGIGIPEEDVPHIFEKFYRASRPGAEIAGTGLGLVFVKHILDMHKGFIKIESKLDHGTTCLVKLPKLQKFNKFKDSK